MNSPFRAAALAALLAVGLSTATQAQTPKMQATPGITLQWLHSLTISPTTVSNVAYATGTVMLRRPAIEDMRIDLCLAGGTQDEAFCHLQGVSILNHVVIRAGGDRANFSFWSNDSVSTGTVTVEARYRQELRTATLTIVPTKRPGSRP